MGSDPAREHKSGSKKGQQPHNKPREERTGACPELQGNIFTLGEKNSGTKYLSTRRAIGQYCGVALHKNMYSLVVNGQESEPTEPTPPVPEGTSTRENPAPITETDKIAYKARFDAYMRDRKEHKEYKGKTFVIILGQCTEMLRNKLESCGSSYNKLYESNDVLGLLTMIKGLIDSNAKEEYVFQTGIRHLQAYFNISQSPNETIAAYENRLHSMREAAIGFWGPLVPAKLPRNDTQQTCDAKLLAYLCIKGADRRRFGTLQQELASNFMTQAGHYPADLPAAISLLRANEQNSQRTSKFDRDRKTDSRYRSRHTDVEQHQQHTQVGGNTSQSSRGRRPATPYRQRSSSYSESEQHLPGDQGFFQS